jgi:elongation factor P
MKVSANSLKQGNVIVHDSRICIITKPPEHTKPGKGPAYIQLELKNLKTKEKFRDRVSSSDYIERAYLEQKEYQYLYAEGDLLIFMDMVSFEQIHLNKSSIDKSMLPFLQEAMVLKIEFFETEPMNFILPTTVTLQIEQTEQVIKGSTAAPSYKPALMSNGITVKVPAYLNSGEKIVVKTEDGSFVERAK